jgi:hypothetical protein
MGVHQHIFEKSSMFNSFLSLQKPLLIKWFGEDIGKLIIGAHILNANVPFLLVISYEMMVDIYVLCSCMLNRIVGELHGTLIIT